MSKDVKFEVVKELCVLSEQGSWRKEANIISWNGGKPKLDIRSWTEGRERSGKGITLDYDEAQILKEFLQENEIDF